MTAAAHEVPAPWSRIAVLEHEVEAERLDVELNHQGIPHVMVSYGDSAFDGLFQAGHGWGHVEAPGKQKDAILSLLEGIRLRSSSESERNTVRDTVKAAEEAGEIQGHRQCVVCNAAIPDGASLCPKCGWAQPGNNELGSS